MRRKKTARKRKTDKQLRIRIARLQMRGCDPALVGPPVKELLADVGDLNCYDIYRMVQISQSDQRTAILEGIDRREPHLGVYSDGDDE
jgi:hypothetical protein